RLAASGARSARVGQLLRAHAREHFVHRRGVGEERDDLHLAILAEHLPLDVQRDLADRDLEDLLEHRELALEERATLRRADVLLATAEHAHHADHAAERTVLESTGQAVRAEPARAEARAEAQSRAE